MKDYTNDPDFFDLLSALHENREFSDQRMQELLARVRSDSDLRKALAAEVQMAALTDTVQRGETRWLALEELIGNQKLSSLESAVMDSVEEHGSVADPARSSKRWLPLALAAALTIFAGSLFLNQAPVDDDSVARVIRVDGELRTESGRSLSKNDRLKPGEKLNMASGLVEMAFIETGVHVLATAPLSITADSRNRIYVHDGEVKLHVPPQGIGFVVETVGQKITDLGTSFVVTARDKGSRVLVLDGEISVDDRQGGQEKLMHEGDLADFDRGGPMKLRSRGHSGVPERALPPMSLNSGSLVGRVYSYETIPGKVYPLMDYIGAQFLPLIKSGFTDPAAISGLKQNGPVRFVGIAGAYNLFPNAIGIENYNDKGGWMAWYSGKVKPAARGKYRFWGYADNHLLVAVDGKPIFEGSRYSSSLREKQRIPRQNHPSLPCLNSTAGFASGSWFEAGDDSVQLDILFGEQSASLTSGLLLIERQGEEYEESFWGQPKWPLFLSEFPSESELAELDHLRSHMEQKLMGSFSIDSDEIWQGHSN